MYSRFLYIDYSHTSNIWAYISTAEKHKWIREKFYINIIAQIVYYARENAIFFLLSKRMRILQSKQSRPFSIVIPYALYLHYRRYTPTACALWITICEHWEQKPFAFWRDLKHLLK